MFLVLNKPIKKLLALIKINIFNFDDDKKEFFKPYFQNFESEDLASIIKKEENIRERYKYAYLTDSAFRKFKKVAQEFHSQVRENSFSMIQGIPTYQILLNPEYAMAF